jgi:hypothetical protein
MRIELPSPSWADVHRAQDDAHTLTLPVHPHVLPRVQLPLGEAGGTASVSVAAPQPESLSLTF